VDPETIATVLDPPVHEAFYLVGPGFDVRAYVLARTDLPDQSDACGTRPTTGLLAAPIDTDRDGNQLRARIEGARSAVRAVLASIEPKSRVRDESEHDERWSKSDADARIDANEFGTDEVEAVLHRALQKSIAEWAARTIPLESIDDGTF